MRLASCLNTRGRSVVKRDYLVTSCSFHVSEASDVTRFTQSVDSVLDLCKCLLGLSVFDGFKLAWCSCLWPFWLYLQVQQCQSWETKSLSTQASLGSATSWPTWSFNHPLSNYMATSRSSRVVFNSLSASACHKRRDAVRPVLAAPCAEWGNSDFLVPLIPLRSKKF